MTLNNITEWNIARLVTGSATSPFALGKNSAVIPNLYHGAFMWGEADLIAITKSGYLIEGEIKLSIQDFAKDKHKNKWRKYLNHWLSDIRHFYYIVPLNIVDRVKNEAHEKSRDNLIWNKK